MAVEELYPPCLDGAPSKEAGLPTESDRAAAAASRLRAIVDQHYSFLWRTLRYLGIPDDVIDDCAQQVLCILARRLADVVPGAEMSFLFSTAVRVASEARRAARRRRAIPVENIDAFFAPGATPEEILDERRAHEVLRKVLEAIPIDLRVVFVLFEIEELTHAEIASLLGLAQGTVASRLRRGREKFRALVRRRSAALPAATRVEGP